MRVLITTLVAAGSILLGSPQTYSQDHVSEGEAQILAAIARDLKRLEVLAGEAERQKLSDTRFPFQYSQLINDLALIRGGINEHLTSPSRSPRRVEPLDGQY